MSILSKLAEGFDIKYDSVVRHVEILRGEGSSDSGSMGGGVRITDTRGNEWFASKVCTNTALVGCTAVLISRGLLISTYYTGYSDSTFSCFEIKHGDFQSTTK